MVWLKYRLRFKYIRQAVSKLYKQKEHPDKCSYVKFIEWIKTGSGPNIIIEMLIDITNFNSQIFTYLCCMFKPSLFFSYVLKPNQGMNTALAHAQYIERTLPKLTKFEKCTSDKKSPTVVKL